MKLLAVVICLSWIGSIWGRACYECDQTDAACSDPFKEDNSLKNNCSNTATYCIKTAGEFQGIKAVTRACDDAGTCAQQGSGCLTVDFGGITATQCCCNTDYCNGAGPVRLMSALATASMGFAAMLIAM
ncbi:uncharacterized protein LOC110977104 [Acanthaster planci]|uniref:Uncharacterized protein LOC110977104 n=1 Tax=Acanthaster planci TaxID=133434 RepID=A0A8B7Y0D4_ACAPL|nr:uncharacterized protein LOC110977104 [Acanthaster planci]